MDPYEHVASVHGQWSCVSWEANPSLSKRPMNLSLVSKGRGKRFYLNRHHFLTIYSNLSNITHVAIKVHVTLKEVCSVDMDVIIGNQCNVVCDILD